MRPEIHPPIQLTPEEIKRLLLSGTLRCFMPVPPFVFFADFRSDGTVCFMRNVSGFESYEAGWSVTERGLRCPQPWTEAVWDHSFFFRGIDCYGARDTDSGKTLWYVDEVFGTRFEDLESRPDLFDLNSFIVPKF